MSNTTYWTIAIISFVFLFIYLLIWTKRGNVPPEGKFIAAILITVISAFAALIWFVAIPIILVATIAFFFLNSEKAD